MKTIIINCPIMQDKIQSLVESIEQPKLTFIKKDGIKLIFNVETDNIDEVVKLVKASIKKDPIAGTIMFNVLSEDYV